MGNASLYCTFVGLKDFCCWDSSREWQCLAFINTWMKRMNVWSRPQMKAILPSGQHVTCFLLGYCEVHSDGWKPTLGSWRLCIKGAHLTHPGSREIVGAIVSPLVWLSQGLRLSQKHSAAGDLWEVILTSLNFSFLNCVMEIILLHRQVRKITDNRRNVLYCIYKYIAS